LKDIAESEAKTFKKEAEEIYDQKMLEVGTMLHFSLLITFLPQWKNSMIQYCYSFLIRPHKANVRQFFNCKSSTELRVIATSIILKNIPLECTQYIHILKQHNMIKTMSKPPGNCTFYISQNHCIFKEHSLQVYCLRKNVLANSSGKTIKKNEWHYACSFVCEILFSQAEYNDL